MIVSFLEKPEKNIANIFFEKNQKLSHKSVGKKIKTFKLNRKINKNTTIIFSFCKLLEIKKFYEKDLFKKKNIENAYLIFNAHQSNLINKLVVITFLFFKKKKMFILFSKNYINSFIPDFLYQIKIRSFFKSIIYFVYQLIKNSVFVFKSKIILIKIK